MIDKYITVSGVRVRLVPYTERRLKALLDVQAEIDAFIEKHPEMTFDEIDRGLIATWWKRKADILWQADKELDEKFFQSEDFESSLLRDSENFFLNNRIYL